MPDTGFRSFDVSGGDFLIGSRAIDGDESTYANLVDFGGGEEVGMVAELEGADLPTSTLVKGIEIKFLADYDAS